VVRRAAPCCRVLICAALCLAQPSWAAPDVTAQARYRQIAEGLMNAPEAARADVEAWRREIAGNGSPDERAGLHRSLAAVHRIAARHDQAAVELNLALQALADTPDSTQVPLAQTELAISYALSGLHSESIPLLRAALKRFEADADWPRASAVLTNLGNSLDAAGDLRGAREHYARALAMKREQGIERGVSALLNNLSGYDAAAGDNAAAVAKLREAVALAAAGGEAVSESLALANLVEVLANQGDYVAAESALEALDRLPTTQIPQRLAARHEAEAILRRREAAATQLPAMRQAKLDSAAAAVAAALQIAQGIDEPLRRAQLLRLASEIDAERGDHARALDRRVAAEAEQVAHEARLQRDRLTVLAARYEQARQAAELAELRARDLRQQTLLLLLLAAVIAVVGYAGWLWQGARGRRREQQRLQAHNEALGVALDRAEAQQRRAERLADQHGRLLQRVGDELREPLMRMRGAAERLLVQSEDPDSLRRTLAGIAESANALIRTSEQMIESGGGEASGAAQAPPVELRELLRGVLADLEASGRGAGAALHLIEDDRSCRTQVDGGRLQLLLMELLQLASRSYADRQRLQVSLVAAADGPRLALDDPSEVLRRRLQQNCGAADGGGEPSLGLLWIHRTIEALGARLEFDGPSVQQIARVILCLPGLR
jgi:signal transduction histidine kinase